MMTISYYSSDRKELGNKPAKQAMKKRTAGRLMVRVAAAALFAILLYSGLNLVKSSANGEQLEPARADERILVVGAGDTLWAIAGKVRNQDEDLRRVVYDIQQRNQLKSSMLKVGQTLIVPAK
ncbi:LysM peptidoglycan-binding domain-containing protein [Paenibacillus sp. GCM10027626]|uniref:LysM peptidoglycan-binding domain-containing protein n=1 Tax=Paenibacillus sp. GCM10027626 TaxID=3273411 RepID=UPI0036275786